jgi:tRNA pseudouridine38-40 synthase
MPRFKLTIEYDGTEYQGWQKQLDSRTVQGELEAAAAKFCGGPTEVVGAGRTDSGVHATAQVAHIDVDKNVNAFNVMHGINFYLFMEESAGPSALRLKNRIAVTDAVQVDDEFHARFSATSRAYLYRIINRRSRLGIEANRAWQVVEPLDEKRMQKAADLLQGHHDFTSFRDTQCQAKSPIKTLDKLDIVRVGDEVRIFTQARSFLHHQVRIMVGTLAMVGKGRWEVADVQKALDARKRAAAGPTAPPDGLYLTKVGY